MLIFAQQIRQVFLNKKKKFLRHNLLVFPFNRKEKEAWKIAAKVKENIGLYFGANTYHRYHNKLVTTGLTRQSVVYVAVAFAS